MFFLLSSSCASPFIARSVFVQLRKFIPTNPIIFMSRDPHEHHQIVLTTGREEESYANSEIHEVFVCVCVCLFVSVSVLALSVFDNIVCVC